MRKLFAPYFSLGSKWLVQFTKHIVARAYNFFMSLNPPMADLTRFPKDLLGLGVLLSCTRKGELERKEKSAKDVHFYLQSYLFLSLHSEAVSIG